MVTASRYHRVLARKAGRADLRLAAMALASSPDPERFVAESSGSSRTVAEYLLAEMLECQPPGVQQLLLRTALLDRVNDELADLLPGHPGSERILLDIEDANAFVVSLDPARTWFRYTTSSLTCSAWSCAGGSPKNCRPCTGSPHSGLPSQDRAHPAPAGLASSPR